MFTVLTKIAQKVVSTSRKIKSDLIFKVIAAADTLIHIYHEIRGK